MRLSKPWLKELGFRLSFIALAIQVAVPFFLAVEMRADAAAAESVAFEHSLCLHDGTPPPQDGSPHHDCNIAGCPLCTALAALGAFGLPGQAGLSVPLATASAAPASGDDQRFTPPFAHIYRSRAPPLA